MIELTEDKSVQKEEFELIDDKSVQKEQMDAEIRSFEGYLSKNLTTKDVSIEHLAKVLSSTTNLDARSSQVNAIQSTEFDDKTMKGVELSNKHLETISTSYLHTQNEKNDKREFAVVRQSNFLADANFYDYQKKESKA